MLGCDVRAIRETTSIKSSRRRVENAQGLAPTPFFVPWEMSSIRHASVQHDEAWERIWIESIRCSANDVAALHAHAGTPPNKIFLVFGVSSLKTVYPPCRLSVEMNQGPQDYSTHTLKPTHWPRVLLKECREAIWWENCSPMLWIRPVLLPAVNSFMSRTRFLLQSNQLWKCVYDASSNRCSLLFRDAPPTPQGRKTSNGPANMQMMHATKLLAQPCGNLCIKSHCMKEGWFAPGINARGIATSRLQGKNWRIVVLHIASRCISSNGTL